MNSFAIAVPIQPGKTQALRDFVADIDGPRRAEEEAFHREFGTKREAMWLQSTPQGDLVVIYWEGEDAESYNDAFFKLVASDDPFGAWLRDRFADIYGLDASAGPPPLPEQVRDLRMA